MDIFICTCIHIYMHLFMYTVYTAIGDRTGGGHAEMDHGWRDCAARCACLLIAQEGLSTKYIHIFIYTHNIYA